MGIDLADPGLRAKPLWQPMQKSSPAPGGGWGEIRTHGELAPTPVFKTGALNRSATYPSYVFYRGLAVPQCNCSLRSRAARPLIRLTYRATRLSIEIDDCNQA